jgi:hypothetical protein
MNGPSKIFGSRVNLKLSSVKDFLSNPGAGYLHSSGENFIKNYKEIVTEEKYYTYIKRFKDETVTMVSNTLEKLQKGAKENKDVIDFLQQVASSDFLKEGSKYLGKFATAWTSFDKQKTLEQIQLSSQELMKLMMDAQSSSEEIEKTGRLDEDTSKRINDGVEKLKEFYNKNQKLGYAPYYAGSVWEMLIALACATVNDGLSDEAKSAFKDKMVTITAGKNLKATVQTDDDGSVHLDTFKFDNQSWADLIVMGKGWKNGKIIKQPLPIQAKFTQNAELRSKLDNASWQWAEDSDWQLFLNLLYYVVNNYGTIKNIPGGDGGNQFYKKVEDLDKSLFARGLIQVLATSKQKSSDLNDTNNNFKYNLFDFIGDSTTGKIIAEPTFSILTKCLNAIGWNSSETEKQHFAYMHISGSDSFNFASYLTQLTSHLGYDASQLRRWQFSKAGAAFQYEGTGNFYCAIIDGSWNNGNEQKILSIRDALNSYVPGNKKKYRVNRLTINPTTIWTSINKKYRFFDGGKNNLDLRFRLNEIYK